MSILTKAQREILIILRDIPNTEIVNPSYRAAYLEKDGGRVKTITEPNFEAIQPWLNSKDSTGYYRFIFDPAAEISDDWPARKLAKDRQEREARRQAEQARKEAEIQKALDYLNISPGTYSVEINNGFTVYIMLGEKMIAHSRVAVSSSDFKTFEDYLSDERNIAHFSQVRDFINRANRE